MWITIEHRFDTFDDFFHSLVKFKFPRITGLHHIQDFIHSTLT